MGVMDQTRRKNPKDRDFVPIADLLEEATGVSPDTTCRAVKDRIAKDEPLGAVLFVVC